MSWIVACVSILAIELAVRKNHWTWALTLANQGLWLYYLLSTHQYGLLPLTAAITIQSIRGWRSWRGGAMCRLDCHLAAARFQKLKDDFQSTQGN